MTDEAMQEVLEELFSSLQALETRTGAILEFLKKQSNMTEEGFAPFCEVAANASSVRWRATRIRMNHLLSSTPTAGDNSQEKSPQTQEKSPQATETREDQPAAQQPAEERRDSEDQDKSAQRTGEDGAEPEDGGARQTNEGDRGAEEKAKDMPADKHAA